jgi:hypothetical protein
MESSIIVLGEKDDILYYNLNQQYSNVKRIIISSEYLFASLEDPSIKVYMEEFAGSDKEDLETNYDNLTDESRKDVDFTNDFYKELVKNLSQISQNLVDFQLKDYNFMNSINNAKFDIILRTECFTIHSHFHEKSTILNAIKNLLKKYIKCDINRYRLSRFTNFQIEILESEDVYKKVYIKKESDNLLVYSTFGFPKTGCISYEVGGEFYTSYGENFNFYKNTQEKLFIREANKLSEKDLKEFEKVLSNEELIAINDKTKNITSSLLL